MALITLSRDELDKYDIVQKAIKKEVTNKVAAILLGLSLRQIKRLKKKVRKNGAAGLIHGNRGKEGRHKITDGEKREIVELLHKHYSDFKPGFASEKLEEIHGIDRDPKTIRAIMIAEGLWKPNKKKNRGVHRAWRRRKDAYGEMEQFDGSYEDWFEDRGPSCCLLASIDDAEGKITRARFAKDEGVMPVFGFWKGYLLKNGRPRAIYTDKFSTYKMNSKFARENHELLTQFQRACNELGIELIAANSPQAKGRIERLFATLQDRLIKELRLAGINTIEEANKFLEEVFIDKFNAKFAVEPVSKIDLHRKLRKKEEEQLDSIFSKQTIRVVQNDWTISFKNQWYQLTEKQPVTVCRKDEVTVEERLDGTVKIRLRGKYLNYEILPVRPKKNLQPWVLPATPSKQPNKPAPDHPWRRRFLYGKNG